jgi:hypothetical protein
MFDYAAWPIIVFISIVFCFTAKPANRLIVVLICLLLVIGIFAYEWMKNH